MTSTKNGIFNGVFWAYTANLAESKGTTHSLSLSLSYSWWFIMEMWGEEKQWLGLWIKAQFYQWVWAAAAERERENEIEKLLWENTK